jgi:tetratricopeptide (TPR) repeat protein
MAPFENMSGESRQEGQVPEVSTRALREQSQRDFELDFLGRVLERDPSHVAALRVHAGNLAAAGQFTRALQADRRLVRLLPERPVPWYNLACSYAVLGMLEPSLAALQRALDLGYRHYRHLLRDPDLATVRSDPRFARLIRRY